MVTAFCAGDAIGFIVSGIVIMMQTIQLYTIR